MAGMWQKGDKQSVPAQQDTFPKKDMPHICRDNLGNSCRCNVCGTVCHTIENDSKGFGIGRVDAWCTVCGASEAYFDDTGGTIFSNLWPDGYVYHEHKEWRKEDCEWAIKNPDIMNIMLPHVDETGAALGSKPFNSFHIRRSLLHPSVLLLPYFKDDDNMCRILVCNMGKPESPLYEGLRAHVSSEYIGFLTAMPGDETNHGKLKQNILRGTQLAVLEAGKKGLSLPVREMWRIHSSFSNIMTPLVPLLADLKVNGWTPTLGHEMEQCAVFAFYIPEEMRTGLRISNEEMIGENRLELVQRPSDFMDFDKMLLLYQEEPHSFGCALGAFLHQCCEKADALEKLNKNLGKPF